MSLYLSTALLTALGNMVLHSLWQASLLALCLWLFSRLYTSSPLGRYRVAMGALVFQLVLGLATFFYFYAPAATPLGLVAPNSPSLPGIAAALPPDAAMPASTQWFPASFYPLLTCVWLAGMLLGALRYLLGHAYLHYYYRKQLHALPVAWEALATNLLKKLHFRGRIPQLCASARLNSPMLLGVFRPLLLFPIASINQLSLEQAEAVLAHELSHLARNDHWWNLFQQIVEVLFYFHPAIHWISQQIREEREHCCDDQVTQLGIDPLCYAKTLFQMEEQGQLAARLALAARPGSLLGRMERLLRQTPNYYRMKPGFLIVLLLLVGSLFAFRPSTMDTAEAKDEAKQGEPLLTYVLDSLPDGKGKRMEIIRSNNNSRKLELQKENGKITLLKVDGERIPEERYPEYEDLIQGLIAPPSAPTPPSPPHGGLYQFFYHTDDDDENSGDKQSRVNIQIQIDGDSLSHGFDMRSEGLNGMEMNLQELVETMRTWEQELEINEDFQLSFPGLDLKLDKRRFGEPFLADSVVFFRLNTEEMETNEELEELLQGFEKKKIHLRKEGADGPADLEDFAWVKRLSKADDKIPSSQKFLSLAKEFQRKALLPQGDIDKLEVSDKKLKINGKKVGDDVFAGFKKAYEDRYRLRWEELGSFSIKVG